MSDYTLERFAADARQELNDGGTDRLPRVAELLRQLLANDAFVAATWGDDTTAVKRVLHHDPETDVYILAHVQPATGIAGPPHTHGTSWAIYGNARGATEMTIWRRLNPEGDAHAELERVETYVLEPGQARAFGSGAIHSTRQTEKALVIRVTGTNLDVLPRFRFRPDRDRIVEAPSVR